MTNTERQRKFKDKKRADEMQQVAIFLSKKDFLKLKVLSLGHGLTYSQIITSILRSKILFSVVPQKEVAKEFYETLAEFKDAKYPPYLLKKERETTLRKKKSKK